MVMPCLMTPFEYLIKTSSSFHENVKFPTAKTNSVDLDETVCF